ncbi:MAG: DNA polymerase III subunit delta' [Alphaproteobacteria bacterium]|nr:DNA polymerase III subunit delta' [Alphaproteobacteria bacterium]
MAPRPRTLDVEPLPESDRVGDLPHPRDQFALFGHESEAATLAAAARSGRLAHAWILGGPKGVGKATLAWRFARALLVHGSANCPDDLSVPSDHPVARRISALAHPDVMLIRRPWDQDRKRHRTELPIEEVRRLNGLFSRFASDDGYRIAIIDAADDMNRAAENALLKTLEEPPRRALLLLVAHVPGALLPTTRSRCRSLTLRPLDAPTMDRALATLAPGLDRDTSAVLAGLAEGCPGRALELVEVGGLELYRGITGVLASLPRLQGEALFALADKVARGTGERGLTLFVQILSGVLQRLVRGAYGSPTQVPGEAQLAARLRSLAPLEGWVGVWENLQQKAIDADALNLDKKQLVLNTFFEMEALVR